MGIVEVVLFLVVILFQPSGIGLVQHPVIQPARTCLYFCYMNNRNGYALLFNLAAFRLLAYSDQPSPSFDRCLCGTD
jgi:hypothetical protein